MSLGVIMEEREQRQADSWAGERKLQGSGRGRVSAAIAGVGVGLCGG